MKGIDRGCYEVGVHFPYHKEDGEAYVEPADANLTLDNVSAKQSLYALCV